MVLYIGIAYLVTGIFALTDVLSARQKEGGT